MIWDQEIFDTWSYNQDRTFFHTFEMEECLAGLSFVDEKEAALFLKKMQNREKHASRATRQTPFGGSGQPASHKHGFLGLGGIFGGHRHSSAPTLPDAPGHGLPAAPSHQSRVSSGSASDLGKVQRVCAARRVRPPVARQFWSLPEGAGPQRRVHQGQPGVHHRLPPRGAAEDTGGGAECAVPPDERPRARSLHETAAAAAAAAGGPRSS